MGDRSKIEWTDSTWNPVTGCTKVSAGCDNCYANVLAQTRLAETYRKRLPVVQTTQNVEDPFAVRLWEERVQQPLRWSDPRMIFVNSMSDLFHAEIPEEFVRAIFEVMLVADQHVYQILTKRPGRALRFYSRHRDLFRSGRRYIPDHIWMGTSIENDHAAFRVGQLVQIPARVRFLSCEPLLDLVRPTLRGIHWVIVGGESGLTYRAMNLDHARALRDQCLRACVPFFFKQVGGRTPKAGGRVLDGREWNEMPTAAARRLGDSRRETNGRAAVRPSGSELRSIARRIRVA
jgi:protein gp37